MDVMLMRNSEEGEVIRTIQQERQGQLLAILLYRKDECSCQNGPSSVFGLTPSQSPIDWFILSRLSIVQPAFNKRCTL